MKDIQDEDSFKQIWKLIYPMYRQIFTMIREMIGIKMIRKHLILVIISIRQDKKLNPPAKAGDSVIVPIPEVDRGKGDIINVVAVVLEISNDDLYKARNIADTQITSKPEILFY